MQMNNFTRELFKKINFYFLFTKFKLHNISLVSTFILGGSQLTYYVKGVRCRLLKLYAAKHICLVIKSEICWK